MASVQQLSPVYPMGSHVDATGRLVIGGCDAVALAREFGTPAYVVVPDDVRARARAMREAFTARDPGSEVVFAAKAFPATAVLALMAQEGLGCDVASAGELALALRAGFPAGRIHLHGNAKTPAEIAAAVDAGIGHIVVDNARDLDLIEQHVAGGAPQPVMLRVAPGVSPDTHPSISTGGPNTKFGVSLDEAPALIARLQASPAVRMDGLHFHIGSQIFATEPFRAALQAVRHLGDFDVINLGGGLGVAYTDADQPPSIEAYVQAKVDAVREILGPRPRIVDEPGRALVANACVTLYTVQTVKRNVVTWVAVDGGMSDNLRPMLYDARYEAQIANRLGGGTPCHVTGKHCESGDVLVRDADLNDPRPGDVLVTPATGAYGYAMANTYNGAPRPPVVFASGGEAHVVVRRETIEDLFARDV